MPTLRLGDYLREDLVLWDLPSLEKQYGVIERFAREVMAKM